MNAESARQFDELEAQAKVLLETFTHSGYEHVAPSVIQPADVFLDVVGEELRGRTYVFTDPDGDELCLRPDVTVPTCRLYLERYPRADTKAKFCYNGPVFRFQPGGGDPSHPREFRQAGIEAFGATDREKSEAEVVALVLQSLAAAGLATYRMRIGDLGFFRAVLKAIDMPERWRQQLRGNFWRPDAFRDLLRQFCSGSVRRFDAPLQGLLDRIDPEATLEEVETLLASYLDENGLPAIGARTTGEVAEQLRAYAADMQTEPLSNDAAELIERYTAVTAPPRAAGARISDLVSARGIDLGEALEVYRRRLDLLAQAGVDLARAEFSGEFGRGFEYYTGFVFQIEVPEFGPAGQIAGGGRYDRLVKSIGAHHRVPAVGAAIHTERLLQVVRGDAS